MTEIIIYARPSHPLTQLELHVARITPEPPPSSPRRRLPRPDDPTPRRPSLMFERALGKRVRGAGETIGGMGGWDPAGRKKVNVVADVKAGIRRTTKDPEGVARLGSGVRLTGDAVFKIPSLPVKTKAGGQVDDVGKGKQIEVVDEENEKNNKLVCRIAPFSVFLTIIVNGSSSKRQLLPNFWPKASPNHIPNSKSCSDSYIEARRLQW
jgi:hypothetical protein